MNARQMIMYSGPKSLSNAELMSVIAGTNIKTANELIDYSFKAINGYGTMEVSEMMSIDGIGEAKACSIVASNELWRRMQSEKRCSYRTQLEDSEQAAMMLMDDYSGELRETFVVINLDCRMRIKSKHTVSIGDMHNTLVHPREVFSTAIKEGASAIIVAHNHPSGDPTPSQPDVEVTERLQKAGEIIGIKLVDHLIIGNGVFTSMRSEGYV